MSDTCEHDWRLQDERLTGPAPAFEDEPFVTWRTWYCTKCRTVETLQDPSAEEAEAQRTANRERQRIAREAWTTPVRPATPRTRTLRERLRARWLA